MPKHPSIQEWDETGRPFLDLRVQRTPCLVFCMAPSQLWLSLSLQAWNARVSMMHRPLQILKLFIRLTYVRPLLWWSCAVSQELSRNYISQSSFPVSFWIKATCTRNLHEIWEVEWSSDPYTQEVGLGYQVQWQPTHIVSDLGGA